MKTTVTPSPLPEFPAMYQSRVSKGLIILATGRNGSSLVGTVLAANPADYNVGYHNNWDGGAVPFTGTITLEN